MADKSRAKLQAAYAAQLLAQNYTPEHAAEASRRAYPTPSQAKAMRPPNASTAALKARWARVRELGLSTLSELARYDAAQRGEV
jgi:hypothetical protein